MSSKNLISLLVVNSVLFSYVTVDAVLTIELQGQKLTPVLSPFNRDGDINLTAISPYAEYLYKNQIRAIELFKPNAGEPYSINLCERKSIIREWLRVNRENNYGFVIVVGVGFLTATDSCSLATYCENNNIDAIAFRPQTDVAPRNGSQAADDLRYVAECAPSTPIFYVYDTYFPKCYPPINVGITHSIAIANITNYAGIIAPIEQCLLARAYDPQKVALYVVSYYYSVAPANILQFDAHSTIFASIFPSLFNRIDSARSTNASLALQVRLNSLARRLCDLRPDCRLPCPMNILKPAFRLVSGIRLETRKPLCDITREDELTVRRILTEEGVPLRF